MSGGALTVAFSAGALAAFNPCGFALLPGWAAVLVSGEGAGDDLLGRLLRALKAGAVATLAFLAVFGAAGVVFSLGFAALGRYLPLAGLAIALVLAWLGTLLLVYGHAPGLNIGRRSTSGTGVRAVFGFGVAYALGSLSCVLPVFILTVGIAAGEPWRTRVGGFVGFALGMGTVLALVALAAALTGGGAQRLRPLLRVIPRVAGAVVLGAAVVLLARELGLATVSLGHPEQSVTFRASVAVAATAVVAAAALLSTRHRAARRFRIAVEPPVTISETHQKESTLTDDCCTPQASAQEQTRTGDGPLVEILYFDGCPNHHPSIALVERVAAELGIDPELRLVNVPDAETAQKVRFLGSPTIRVAGRDVDPRTEERNDYQLACRIFQTDAGLVGQPEERWVRDALLRE